MASSLFFTVPLQPDESGQEKLWKKISGLFENITHKQMDKQKKQAKLNNLLDQCEEFRIKYPHSSHMTQLWEIVIQIMMDLVFKHKDSESLDILISDTSIPPSKASILYQMKLVQINVQHKLNKSAIKPMEEKAREFMACCKDIKYSYQPLLFVAQSAFRVNEKDIAKRLFTECSQSTDPSTQEEALLWIKLMDLENQPFELKFRDVRGRQVDISAMQGKVILLYFWNMEQPSVKELGIKASHFTPYNIQDEIYYFHETYKGKELEVIGICLDDETKDKETLLNENKYPWPQYVDPEDKEAILIYKHCIKKIPTLWLIDKNGFLVDRNAEINTEEKIQNLLN